jgi:hypothetical protein
MIDPDGQRLAELIEQQFFGPILDSNPDELPPHQRGLAADLQGELARERERLRESSSAVALTQAFGAYARERAADLDPRLAALGLPKLGDLRYDVEKLAAELGLHWQDGEDGRGPRGRRQDA